MLVPVWAAVLLFSVSLTVAEDQNEEPERGVKPAPGMLHLQLQSLPSYLIINSKTFLI